MKLNKRRFRGHLPIHSKRFLALDVPSWNPFDSALGQEALALRPNGADGVERLQLYADEVTGFTAPDRRQSIVDTTTWELEFGNDVQFVPRFVSGEQMQTISKYLSAFKKAQWTY